jgi:hypothetical protein
VLGRVGGSTKKMMITDMYCNNQREKGSSMGWVANKCARKWVESMKTIGLKMISTTVVRGNIGIQWDRFQIRVDTGPLYLLFLLLQSYTPN